MDILIWVGFGEYKKWCFLLYRQSVRDSPMIRGGETLVREFRLEI